MKKSIDVDYDHDCTDAFGFHQSTSQTKFDDDALEPGSELKQKASRRPKLFHPVPTTVSLPKEVAWRLKKRKLTSFLRFEIPVSTEHDLRNDGLLVHFEAIFYLKKIPDSIVTSYIRVFKLHRNQHLSKAEHENVKRQFLQSSEFYDF